MNSLLYAANAESQILLAKRIAASASPGGLNSRINSSYESLLPIATYDFVLAKTPNFVVLYEKRNYVKSRSYSMPACSILGVSQAPATHCTRKSPLPLLPSGPGGVGGNASRGTDA